jgi:membrane protein
VVAGVQMVLNSFRSRPLVSVPISFGRDFVTRFGEFNVSIISGGLAYYVILALAPIAISVGAIAGLFLDRQQFMAGWDSFVSRGPDSLSGLEPAVDALATLAQAASTSSVTVTTIVSIILAVYVSQKVVYGFLQVHDHIFHNIRRAPGLMARARSALFALILIVGIVATLLAVTVVPVVLSALNIETTFLEIFDQLGWLAPGVFVYLLVWFVMRRASGTSGVITWRSPGLLVSTSLIILSVGGFGIYAQLSTSVASALIVFGAPIAVLIWTYFVFLGFFTGSIVQDVIRDRGLARKPTWGSADEGDQEGANSGTSASTHHGESGQKQA